MAVICPANDRLTDCPYPVQYVGNACHAGRASVERLKAAMGGILKYQELMPIKQSSRARGSNRGGVGGGYEKTDPDYEKHRIERLRKEYDELPAAWKGTYLKGLSKWDQKLMINRREV